LSWLRTRPVAAARPARNHCGGGEISSPRSPWSPGAPCVSQTTHIRTAVCQLVHQPSILHQGRRQSACSLPFLASSCTAAESNAPGINRFALKRPLAAGMIIYGAVHKTPGLGTAGLHLTVWQLRLPNLLDRVVAVTRIRVVCIVALRVGEIRELARRIPSHGSLRSEGPPSG
jgi:hypothetical protein